MVQKRGEKHMEFGDRDGCNIWCARVDKQKINIWASHVISKLKHRRTNGEPETPESGILTRSPWQVPKVKGRKWPGSGVFRNGIRIVDPNSYALYIRSPGGEVEIQKSFGTTRKGKHVEQNTR